MKSKFHAMINDDTKQTVMTKFRGRENGRIECYYHEREGGIVYKVAGQNVAPLRGFSRGFSSELPNMTDADSGSLSFLFLLFAIFVSCRFSVPVVGCLCTPYLDQSFLPQFLKLTPLTRRNTVGTRDGDIDFTSSSTLACVQRMGRDRSDLLVPEKMRDAATHNSGGGWISVSRSPCIIYPHARLNGASCGCFGVRLSCRAQI